MPSKSFTAKWANTCANCQGAIKVGDQIRYAKPGEKALCHDPVCPGVGSSSPPPPAAHPGLTGDAPIYTYHRVLKLWNQGMQVGEVNLGVSVKGRTLLDIEIASVDDRVRACARLNERGELLK